MLLLIDLCARCNVYPLYMPHLRNIIIADPSEKVAEMVAEQTELLATHRHIACNGEALLALAQKHAPEAIILSLELQGPSAEEAVKLLQKADAKAGRTTFIIATFRELAVSKMDQLDRLGIEDFLPQPIDFVQLFRATSLRFQTGFRRHVRYQVELEVARHDGKVLGTTFDLSEGGLSFRPIEGIRAGQSIFIRLDLPDSGVVRARCAILDVDGDSGNGGLPGLARARFENLRGQEQQRLLSFLSSRQEKPN